MQPLAERMRPKVLDDFVGQEHLVGQDAVLRKILEHGRIPSMVFWGPPGVGKTTLARILSESLDRPFFTLSAINSGVKEVREVIEKAKNARFFSNPSPILFIDEIHRFSKSQQDSLLGAVEQGTIVLIGATTENPSFEVIPALLSRCQVYVLKPLSEKDLTNLVHKVAASDYYLKKKKLKQVEYDALIQFAHGDARKLLSIMELVFNLFQGDTWEITNDIVTKELQENPSRYDKGGEMHYDIISAYIKSIRGGDPDAALYWLARMVEGGEDVKFIARRLIILASEDIGLANPNALLLANACFDSVAKIGWPESRIILSQATIYMANSPKDNSAYVAIKNAQAEVKQSGILEVPLHLRNAPTTLMKDMGYGEGYKYPHDYSGGWVKQDYLPEKIKGKQFWFKKKK